MKKVNKPGQDESSPSIWTLSNHGQRMDCFVIEVAGGGFELHLLWSPRGEDSTQRFPLRDVALAEARRLAMDYIALGWRIHHEES